MDATEPPDRGTWSRDRRNGRGSLSVLGGLDDTMTTPEHTEDLRPVSRPPDESTPNALYMPAEALRVVFRYLASTGPVRIPAPEKQQSGLSRTLQVFGAKPRL